MFGILFDHSVMYDVFYQTISKKNGILIHDMHGIQIKASDFLSDIQGDIKKEGRKILPAQTSIYL